MDTSTHPGSIGLLEYRYITKNGLSLKCFLTYREGTQEKMHLVHALTGGTDIMEIMRPEIVEHIEAEAQANMDGCHVIAAFVDMRIPQKLNSGMRTNGWLA